MAEVTIRQVDPAAERERILAVLAASLPAAAMRDRFDWLYLANPAGPALVWLAEHDNVAVGTSAAHRRRMRVDGATVPALTLGDFAIDASHRSLGPALRLLRATLAPIHAGDFAVSYDFSNASMHAVYRRMQVHSLGHSERWMLPVSITHLLREKLGHRPLAAVVGGVGDVLWQGRRALQGRADGVQVERLQGDCGAEFDALDVRLARPSGVAGVRDGAYLTWRYRRNPVWRHELLCARRAGELTGYAVLRPTAPNVVALLDLCAEDEAVARALLSSASDWARKTDAAALHVEVLAEGPAAHLVQALGFVRREAQPGPLVCRPPDAPRAATLDAAASWWLLGGDRDV
jgi:GNAT superfamily N-acetyltransferase